MTEEIHIIMDNSETPIHPYTTFVETDSAILRGERIVYTTQPHFLSFRYTSRLFVHYKNKIHEINRGNTEGTDRIIKDGHNLERMLIAGEFNWF